MNTSTWCPACGASTVSPLSTGEHLRSACSIQFTCREHRETTMAHLKLKTTKAPETKKNPRTPTCRRCGANCGRSEEEIDAVGPAWKAGPQPTAPSAPGVQPAPPPRGAPELAPRYVHTGPAANRGRCVHRVRGDLGV
jgi:hypothetical protein